MKAVTRLSISLALALTASVAMADSPKLKGSYAFTGSHMCIVAPGSVPASSNPTPGVALPGSGFSANLTTPGATAFSVSSSVAGVRTFNGDGTGTVTGRGIGLALRPTPGPGPNVYPAFPPSASADTFSYSFTYTVNRDGTFTMEMTPGSYAGTFVAGPRTGQTYTVDIPPFTGAMGVESRDLVIATTEPTVETIKYSNGDVWPRICNRTRTMVRMQN